jgi:GDSL/SGNH-like Acyl-Esterase family found in Pmr5 and Cas1p
VKNYSFLVIILFCSFIHGIIEGLSIYMYVIFNIVCRMQQKTLAFVGDSLGRQQFQSIMCMITGGKPAPQVLDVGWEFGLVKARGALRPDGWAYRFPRTNTTVLFYWSASLCELQPLLNESDPKSVSYALHLDRPVTFLKKYLDRSVLPPQMKYILELV